MTNYNNTDKIIREKFESIDPSFDAESMWAELAPVVEKKKRRGFFFWSLLGLALIATVFGFVNFYSIDEHLVMTSIDKKEDAIVKYNTESESESKTQMSDDKSKVIENNLKLNTENVVSDISAESLPSMANSEPYVARAKSGNANMIDQTNTAQLFSKLVVDSQEENEVFSNQNFNSKNIAIESTIFINKLPIRDFSLKYNSAPELLFDFELDDNLSTRPLSNNKWRIALNGGYYIHSRSFKNSGQDISENFSSRSKEEDAKDGYDLGVRLEYFLNDHFALLGGVRFSQAFIQRSASYSYTETIVLKDHVVAIINTEQGPQEVKEDVTYDGVFMHDAENYITDSRLGLFAGLQYRLRLEKWTTHLNLGLEIPFWSSHSGVITNNQRPYNLSDDTESINTTSIQMFSGIGLEYSLTPTTALQATIGGFMPLKNEHVASYNIEKKSSLLGLNLGVHFRL